MIQKNIDNEDIIIIGELLESEDSQTKFINDSHNLENKIKILVNNNYWKRKTKQSELENNNLKLKLL